MHARVGNVKVLIRMFVHGEAEVNQRLGSSSVSLIIAF